MWQFEHSLTTTAKAETIWELYRDITTWPTWDKGIVSASLGGPFVQGTRGLLQPEGQDPLPFELTEVNPLHGFSDITDIPGAGIQVQFTHLLEESNGTTKVTHQVKITGPNAEQLGPKFGAHMVEGIPHTMKGLTTLALEKEQTQINKQVEKSRRYWIGVVSASHVARGVEGGFAQLCHGKAAPLKRMQAGDWLIYYSPRTDMQNGDPLQAFTAIGQVQDDYVYKFRMSDSFIPFRRNIRYTSCKETKISSLLEQLSFTRGVSNWGYRFRFGHFEISEQDFRVIANAMLDSAEGKAHELRIQ